MPIPITCPSCGVKARAPDAAAGHRLKCPKCGQALIVPSIAAGPPDVEPLPPAPPPRAGRATLLACPHCDGQVAFDKGLAGQLVTCPHCAGEMEMPAAPPAVPVPPVPPTTDWAEAAEEPPVRRRRGRGGPAIVAVVSGVLGGAGLLALGAVLLWPVLSRRDEAAGVATGGGGTKTNGTGQAGKGTPPPALTEKQRAAVAEAIKALDRVDAATRVGVNIGKYQDRVADALPAVENAQRLLPPGALNSALTQAITAYKDAALLWSGMVQFPDVSLRSPGIGHEEILDRYGIKKLTSDEQTKMIVQDGLAGIRVDNQITLSTIWQAAANAIKAAKAMQ